MPFLAKMSAHFRGGGYSAKEPQSKTIYKYEEDYYPSRHERRLHSNKDKIVDYDNYDYRHYNDSLAQKSLNNGPPHEVIREGDRDNDWLYSRSKEKFSKWDTRNFEDQRDTMDKKKSSFKYDRVNPIENVDVEVEEIFVNGESSSSMGKRNGILREDDRSGSVARRRERVSESLDRQNGKFRRRRNTEFWSEEENNRPIRSESEERGEYLKNNNNNRDHFFRDNYAFGSLKKKNEKNAGLNLGFRALVDKFRAKNDDREKKDSVHRNKKQEYVDEDWRYNNGESRNYKARKSPDKFEIYPPKESKTERNHRIRDHEYSDEPRSRIRFPTEEDDEEDYCYPKGTPHYDADRTKRRSYAFEASPDDFDVRIQKYERKRRDDPDFQRRNSFHDRGPKNTDDPLRTPTKDYNLDGVARKSSLRDKSKDALKRRESIKSKPPKPKISERHSRPLTPPLDQQAEVTTSSKKEQSKDYGDDPPRKSFSMKEWYENNRQFAAKYLKEHSKIKELSTSDVSAKDEFVFGSPKETKYLHGNDNHERRYNYRIESKDNDINDDSRRRYRVGRFDSSNNEPTTVVKFKTNTRDDPTERRSNGRRDDEVTNDTRRRHRRESVEDEEEEEEEEEYEEEAQSRRSESYGRSFVMPTRKIWDYRDGVWTPVIQSLKSDAKF